LPPIILDADKKQYIPVPALTCTAKLGFDKVGPKSVFAVDRKQRPLVVIHCLHFYERRHAQSLGKLVGTGRITENK